jgi:hypothetical protein
MVQRLPRANGGKNLEVKDWVFRLNPFRVSIARLSSGSKFFRFLPDKKSRNTIRNENYKLLVQFKNEN